VREGKGERRGTEEGGERGQEGVRRFPHFVLAQGPPPRVNPALSG